MNVHVRTATAADAPLLADLNRHVQDVHVLREPELYKEAAHGDVVACYRKLLERSTVRAWVAEINGAPLGYVVAELSTKPETPFTHARRFCELDQIAVAPRHRRKGVGAALVDAVIDHARREGATEVQLGTRHWNAEAQAFFGRQREEPAARAEGLTITAGAGGVRPSRRSRARRLA